MPPLLNDIKQVIKHLMTNAAQQGPYNLDFICDQVANLRSFRAHKASLTKGITVPDGKI